jgi:hypothetical protein
MAIRAKCPHCGNTDQATIESNGVSSEDVDYTLLCVARVKPADRSWGHVEPAPDQTNEDGLVECGYQWSPNDG